MITDEQTHEIESNVELPDEQTIFERFLHFHRCDLCFRALSCKHRHCLETYSGPYRGGRRTIAERCKKCIKSVNSNVLPITIE